MSSKKTSMVDPLPACGDPKTPWLIWPPVDHREPIASKRQSWSRDEERGCSISIDNLTRNEMEVIESMLRGASFVSVVDGRLHAWSRFDQLETIVDDDMDEHWNGSGNLQQFSSSDRPCAHSFRVFLNHLLDKKSIRLAEEMGFVRMRSRRSPCSRYWEVWKLEDFAARGSLGVYEKSEEYRSLPFESRGEAFCKKIIDTGIRFGSMDLAVQTWALCFD